MKTENKKVVEKGGVSVIRDPDGIKDPDGWIYVFTLRGVVKGNGRMSFASFIPKYPK